MQQQLNRKSNLWTGIGFAASVLGFWLLIYRDGFDTLGRISLCLGLLLLFLGFVYYVRAKGYPASWCLLFFAGGFLFFFFLPDRENKDP